MAVEEQQVGRSSEAAVDVAEVDARVTRASLGTEDDSVGHTARPVPLRYVRTLVVRRNETETSG
ncbi:hypothetical protein NJ76_01210 [Rhodococcus sp. IITR03]|nr:hypothetical protein NJ76_01210 [Rhodococcus sp. IITR03]